jgi:hypothetical protein
MRRPLPPQLDAVVIKARRLPNRRRSAGDRIPLPRALQQRRRHLTVRGPILSAPLHLHANPPPPHPLNPNLLQPQSNAPPRSNVTSTVTPTFTSYDETGTGPYSDSPATSGSQAFYDSLTTSSGPSSFGNATQNILFAIHDCDHVAYRWVFRAWSTGFNA